MKWFIWKLTLGTVALKVLRNKIMTRYLYIKISDTFKRVLHLCERLSVTQKPFREGWATWRNTSDDMHVEVWTRDLCKHAVQCGRFLVSPGRNIICDHCHCTGCFISGWCVPCIRKNCTRWSWMRRRKSGVLSVKSGNPGIQSLRSHITVTS